VLRRDDFDLHEARRELLKGQRRLQGRDSAADDHDLVALPLHRAPPVVAVSVGAGRRTIIGTIPDPGCGVFRS